MNKKRAYYYPILVYLLILLVVWVGAFFVDVFQMLSDVSYHSSSLISAAGVRWAVRTALTTLNALPWGTVMLFIVTLGLLNGSGIARVVWRLICFKRLTVSELRSFSFSLAAVLCYAVLLYISTISSWGIFRGLTDEPSLSPIVQGWTLLLFIGLLLASAVYGFIYGNYRSVMDIVVATSNSFVIFVPALLALIPASGIVPCLDYAGVHETAWLSWEIVEALLYLLPFIYVVVLQAVEKET